MIFVSAIAQSATEGQAVRVTSALLQPIASEDVAATLADLVEEGPLNGTIEVAGPESLGLDQLVQQFFKATNDPRKVVTDPHARYFGLELNDKSLTPGDNPRMGSIRFAEWLKRSQ